VIDLRDLFSAQGGFDFHLTGWLGGHGDGWHRMRAFFFFLLGVFFLFLQVLEFWGWFV
jgi:hypothetical protein